MIHSEAWRSCASLVDPAPYTQACVQDMCGCGNRTDDFCVCSTLAEFSRQCSHAGGLPPSWRTPQFCGSTFLLTVTQPPPKQKHLFVSLYDTIYLFQFPKAKVEQSFNLFWIQTYNTTFISLIAKTCPFNMVYEESGSPCMATCTHSDTSSLCEDHKMDGCFCPAGKPPLPFIIRKYIYL